MVFVRSELLAPPVGSWTELDELHPISHSEAKRHFKSTFFALSPNSALNSKVNGAELPCTFVGCCSYYSCITVVILMI